MPERVDPEEFMEQSAAGSDSSPAAMDGLVSA